ncbi:HIRAN domain-containing protein [Lysinibacillus xylanilyticus]|uniref:HIRAN domain-containing protein n=1 Tax=Lysinibacillus xylanilyticus TaxID=582475 RepID=UPI00380E53FF
MERIFQFLNVAFSKQYHELNDGRTLSIYTIYYTPLDTVQLNSHPVRKAWILAEDAGMRVGFYKYRDKSKLASSDNLSGYRSFPIEREEYDKYGDYSQSNGGLREDLSGAFKSSWEANIARLLNYLGYTNWQYEEIYIQTSDGTYIPDFSLTHNNQQFVIEVKGVWDNRSVTKVSETLRSANGEKIVLIDADIYTILSEHFSSEITNWEDQNTRLQKISIPVVGIKVGDRLKYIKQLSDGDELILEREPENPYDFFAIKVMDKQKNQVGYLRKDWATIISTKLEYGFKYRATLKEKKLNSSCLIIQLDNINKPSIERFPLFGESNKEVLK